MKKFNFLLKTLAVVLLMMTPLVFHAKNHDVRGMAKHIDRVYLSATPEILENNGNTITVTIEAEFPPRYFAKKAVMNITPILVYEEGETELPSMNFIGQKVEGDGVVVSRKHGGAYSYTVTIPYKDEMYNSLLIIEPIVYKFKEVVHPDHMAIKEHESFAPCSSFLVAQGVINTANEIDKSSLKTAMVKPSKEEIIVTDNGDIFFAVNSGNINWNNPLNKLAQNQIAIDKLTSHILKGWNVQNIEITGWASPEGSVKYNNELSNKRAKMTELFLKNKLANITKVNKSDISYKNVNDIKFITKGNGPDWNGLMQAIEKSTIKDKQNIINTLKKQNPEQRIAQLDKYIKQYPELEKTILPSLRRSVISINTVEPKMTEQQITETCVKDPKSLNCNQMIYAATLVKEKKNKELIYVTAMETYPQCAEPFCNAGALAIENGKIKHAKKFLKRAIEIDDMLAEAYNNLGIVAIYENDYAEAEKLFSHAKKLGLNTNYNEGVIHINKGNYDKAVKLMTKDNPNCDYNIALAQTMDKKYTVAEETVSCLEENGKTLYLHAVIASRTNNIDKAIKHLAKAIKKDPKLKNKAKNDMEFAYLQDNSEFMALVKP